MTPGSSIRSLSSCSGASRRIEPSLRRNRMWIKAGPCCLLAYDLLARYLHAQAVYGRLGRDEQRLPVVAAPGTVGRRLRQAYEAQQRALRVVNPDALGRVGRDVEVALRVELHAVGTADR